MILKSFYGIRHGEVGIVYMQDRTLAIEPSLMLKDHSPQGFDWGYTGSGPAQLALAVLLECTNVGESLEAYQDFKFQMVARLPWQGWAFTNKDVISWLEGYRLRRQLEKQGRLPLQ